MSEMQLRRYTTFALALPVIAAVPVQSTAADQRMSLPVHRSYSGTLTPHASTAQWAGFLAWGELRAKMIGWSNLQPGWDGADAERLSPSTVRAAIAFLDKAQASGISKAPQPYIAADGEVGFRWAKGNAFASIAFLADGSVVGVLNNALGELTEFDVSAAHGCPDEAFASIACLV